MSGLWGRSPQQAALFLLLYFVKVVIQIPYVKTPTTADITISRMGDNFFFLKYLYPSIAAINITVMIMAL